MRPEIHSKDFGSSWKLFLNNNSISCVFGVHSLVACFHTRVGQMQTTDTQWKEKIERQTYITNKHTQTTHTAQTHHTSIPTVVVFLMIHDNLLIAFWR